MLHLAVNQMGAFPQRMPLTVSPERAEQKLIGQALRQIREAKRWTQAQVAEKLGLTTQAWQKYEAGERRFSDERLATVLEILGSTEEDLEFARARALGVAAKAPAHIERRTDFVFDVYGRARAGAIGPEAYDVAEPIRRVDLRQMLGPRSDAVEVAGDSVVPWAQPGELVFFDRDRYPRRGQGCVIEMHSGDTYVKLYERSDGSTLFVSELFPEERTISFPLREVKAVSAVSIRGG